MYLLVNVRLFCSNRLCLKSGIEDRCRLFTKRVILVLYVLVSVLQYVLQFFHCANSEYTYIRSNAPEVKVSTGFNMSIHKLAVIVTSYCSRISNVVNACIQIDQNFCHCNFLSFYVECGRRT